MNDTSDPGAQIIAQAKELGATIAGIASVEHLRLSPSHTLLEKHGTKLDGHHTVPGLQDCNAVQWPASVRSALVIGLAHPPDQPELDWFDANGNTPGNRILIGLNKKLSAWIEATFEIKTYRMSYYVEKGGLYLKDAAELAGLGCVGKNNLFISPELGPRVRLRAMLLEAKLTPTGPVDFAPCADCEEFCRQACPRKAFKKLIHSPTAMGLDDLPGRDGTFSRGKCMFQMGLDVLRARVRVNQKHLDGVDLEEASTNKKRIKYCRECEFACPVGEKLKERS